MAELREFESEGQQLVELRHGEISAVISPTFGAACVSLRWGDRELLHGANKFDGGAMGGRIPVLFPTVGRSFEGCELGIYRHKGTVYPMQIHGFAKDKEWSVAAKGAMEECAWVVCRLVSDDQTLAHYPYPFRLDICYMVRNGAFEMVATVENRGDVPMPFCFGYHPYFRVDAREDCVLRVPARCVYEMSEGQPTGEILPAPEQFREGLPIPSSHLENILGDLERNSGENKSVCELTDNRAGARLLLEFEPSKLETITVYSPEGAKFVCIEPRTGLPNSLSDSARICADMKILSPWREFTTTVSIRLERQ